MLYNLVNNVISALFNERSDVLKGFVPPSSVANSYKNLFYHYSSQIKLRAKSIIDLSPPYFAISTLAKQKNASSNYAFPYFCRSLEHVRYMDGLE